MMPNGRQRHAAHVQGSYLKVGDAVFSAVFDCSYQKFTEASRSDLHFLRDAGYATFLSDRRSSVEKYRIELLGDAKPIRRCCFSLKVVKAKQSKAKASHSLYPPVGELNRLRSAPIRQEAITHFSADRLCHAWRVPF